VARPYPARRPATRRDRRRFLSVLELGFAWPDADAAVTDAMSHIDHFGRSYIASEAQATRSALKH